VLVAEIAKLNLIPKKFLDSILRDLRNAGLLRAKKGKGGGYMLARSATAITVGEVVRVLDGPLEPIACAGRSRSDHCDDCPDKAECVIQQLMREVASATNRIVDGKTLADLAMSGNSMWAMMRPNQQ
jgi:Rrf2 family protein